MRDFVNATIRAVKPSGIRRFFDIAAEMDNVISLGVGEPDFDTPWNVREAAIHSLEQGQTIYTANAGLKELRRAIAAYVNRKYNLEYDPLSQILVTVGGSEAIDIGLRVILEPGDEVLIPEPSYVAYIPCATMAGGKPKIDRRACIRCFCCQDFCPRGALSARRSPSARLINREVR